ncbi:RNA polymerase sigma factor [Candidatus Latescibacterota bacterium]
MLVTTMTVKKNEPIPDKDILFRIINDDLEAFEILVDRYKNRLINFVFRFVKDFDVAEDIVQETFLRVFKHRHNYKAIANFSTWIFTIAGNLAKSELRRRKRWRFLSVDAINDGEKKFELPDNHIKPDRATSVRILDENIQISIDSLQDKYKESLILRDIEGMSYKEIAEITKVPVGTVKSRVNRARKKLQKKLKGHTPDDELFYQN